jgi:hypothetical protein
MGTLYRKVSRQFMARYKPIGAKNTLVYRNTGEISSAVAFAQEPVDRKTEIPAHNPLRISIPSIPMRYCG